MIDCQVDEDYAAQVDTGLLARAARAALAHQGADPEASLAVVITGDDQLQELNRQYLGVDAPTDVLSFPADYTDPETSTPYLGDVLVSFPRAQAQSEAAGHALESELQLLVVHGVLHLLGHDHLEPDEKAVMWAAQAEILESLGVKIASLPE